MKLRPRGYAPYLPEAVKRNRPPRTGKPPDHDGPRAPAAGRGPLDHAFVVSSTSSSGSRPGVFRSNLVMARRKTT